MLAYGQTGSGKTYSMGGGYDMGDNSINNDIVGIIPRVIRALYCGIRDRADEFDFNVGVSYLEVSDVILCCKNNQGSEYGKWNFNKA